MAIFLIPTVIVSIRQKSLPNRHFMGILIVLSIVLTLISMVIDGSRGGMPPEAIYGWPKEIIGIRAGEPFYFFASSTMIDFIFYLVFLLGLFNFKKMLSRSK